MTDSVEDSEAELRALAWAELCGPGAPFEVHGEDVRGTTMGVFARRHRSVGELLDHAVDAAPASGYLTVDGTTIDRAAFRAQVHAAAAGLAARHGVGPGDRIAILAANCVEWAVTFFAAAHLGAVPCGFNGWWTAAEVDHALELTEPTLLVGDARRLERVPEDSLDLPVVRVEDDWSELLGAGAGQEVQAAPVGEDDPGLILFTSGTTGAPRAAVISHRGIVGFVQTHRCNGALRARVAASESGRDTASGPLQTAAPLAPAVTLMTSPMFHVSGLLAGVVMGLVAGNRLVLRRGRFDPLDVLALIERERVTHWSPLGNTGPRVIHHPDFARHDTSSLRQLGFGGGPVSPARRAELQAAFPNVGVAVGTGYGSTETVATVASISGDDYEQHPDSVGRALPTCHVEIRDQHDRAVPDGTAGRIVVRSPYTFLGYRSDAAGTASVLLSGGHLDTGDIGVLRDGMLTVDSRARDLIIRSGENVSPVEVERRLDAHPAVRECAVIGHDHPEHGQEVAAIVVVDRSVGDDELAGFCAQTLAPYKVPTRWVQRVEPLPRNAAGKVLKRDLTGDAPGAADPTSGGAGT